jgi:release factor glutamine methyltransferase
MRRDSIGHGLVTAAALSPTIGAAWRQTRDRLAAAGIDSPSLDARLLAQSVFDLDAVGLAISEKNPADAQALRRLRELTSRRLAREPIARILGEKEFYGLGFALSPDTLVPRPETELVVDLARAALEGRAAPRLLDLGTGTGCIAIAMLANLPRASAVATDLSPDALATARANAARHEVGDRVDFRQGDWFAPVAADETYDVIVSNPPYIAHTEIDTLDPEVRQHDPHLALDGGEDGLVPYHVLARQSGRHLCRGGKLIVEHGAGQKAALLTLFARHGFVELAGYADFGGHDRVLVATWRG